MSQPRLITAFSNERVKLIRSLELRKARKETGLFVAEGSSVLLTAREHGIPPKMLVYRTGSEDHGATTALIAWAAGAKAEILEVSPQVLEKIAAKENPQSLLGVFEARFAEPPQIEKLDARDTWIALEEVRDPGNLGTIIRTADAAGVAGIILAGTCCDPTQRECVRATMGSIFTVPLVKLEQPAFLDLLAVWPGSTIGTHLAGAIDYRRIESHGPELIVMGREGPGLTDAAAAACKSLVKIPMAGDIDSLNLAIATALVVYQVRTNRL